MSTYQYYEWLAIDRPLEDDQLSEVVGLSSHMETATPTQAFVSYSYGSFKHDPLDILARHFDAFLYSANWGTRQLAFRLPNTVISAKALKPWLIDRVVTVKQLQTHLILDISFDLEDQDGEWVDGTRLLASLSGLRRQLINGDYRVLYLVWLATTSRRRTDDDVEGDSIGDEPPVPEGLQTLDGSLSALCAFLDVDRTLVAAAAAGSANAKQPTDADLRAAIARLPRARCDAYLFKLLQDTPQLGSELRNELGMTGASVATRTGAGRSIQTLIAAAHDLTRQSQILAQKKAEHERIAELEALGARGETVWEDVAIALDKKTAAGQNTAVKLLIDLHDMSRHRKTGASFRLRFEQIVKQYGRSRALMNRLEAAGLL